MVCSLLHVYGNINKSERYWEGQLNALDNQSSRISNHYRDLIEEITKAYKEMNNRILNTNRNGYRVFNAAPMQYIIPTFNTFLKTFLSNNATRIDIINSWIDEKPLPKNYLERNFPISLDVAFSKTIFRDDYNAHKQLCSSIFSKFMNVIFAKLNSLRNVSPSFFDPCRGYFRKTISRDYMEAAQRMRNQMMLRYGMKSDDTKFRKPGETLEDYQYRIYKMNLQQV